VQHQVRAVLAAVETEMQPEPHQTERLTQAAVAAAHQQQAALLMPLVAAALVL
jgi:hypothetical protein